MSRWNDKWCVLNNILWETNGENDEEWFDFYYHSVTDDFVYTGTYYTNNNSILQQGKWNSKQEFFISGNPEMNNWKYRDMPNVTSSIRRIVSTNAYTKCRENDTSYAHRILYTFIHVIDTNTLQSNIVFNKIDEEFIYNSTQNQWLVKSILIGIWE
eukprot:145279_1